MAWNQINNNQASTDKYDDDDDDGENNNNNNNSTTAPTDEICDVLIEAELFKDLRHCVDLWIDSFPRRRVVQVEFLG